MFPFIRELTARSYQFRMSAIANIMRKGTNARLLREICKCPVDRTGQASKHGGEKPWVFFKVSYDGSSKYQGVYTYVCVV